MGNITDCSSVLFVSGINIRIPFLCNENDTFHFQRY